MFFKKKCPSCGAKNDKERMACAECGAPLALEKAGRQVTEPLERTPKITPYMKEVLPTQKKYKKTALDGFFEVVDDIFHFIFELSSLLGSDGDKEAEERASRHRRAEAERIEKQLAQRRARRHGKIPRDKNLPF